jgi:hypothetical protein
MPFNQFGRRSNASCLDTALSLTHDIHEDRHRGLVSSFLAIDIKGFFDHVNHDRLVSVLCVERAPCARDTNTSGLSPKRPPGRVTR